MMRRMLMLFVLIGLCAARPAQAMDLPGEGYAWPDFKELAQTFILMGGEDITKSSVADEYGRIIYCTLYKGNFNDDVAWKRIRDRIVSRVIDKKEYYRTHYQVVSTFNLGRYDFKTQTFPVLKWQALENVGYIRLYQNDWHQTFCKGGSDPIFLANVVLKIAVPLTIDHLSISKVRVSKLLARFQEAHNVSKKVYARIRMVVTGTQKGVNTTAENVLRFVLTGHVTTVDFFLDPQLSEPIGHQDIAQP